MRRSIVRLALALLASILIGVARSAPPAPPVTSTVEATPTSAPAALQTSISPGQSTAASSPTASARAVTFPTPTLAPSLPTSAASPTVAASPSQAASFARTVPARSPTAARIAGALTWSIDPDRRWSVQYPPSLLHVEPLGDDVVLFVSQDRRSFVAVDSFDGGSMNEDRLRSRARATLQRIYRSGPFSRWGFSDTTPLGRRMTRPTWSPSSPVIAPVGGS
ncbi:MAG: hypothetical protein HY331_04595 [Chloroflexi bacterium]|nr:hypothetical protein [Chloroflexota bacterium]